MAKLQGSVVVDDSKFYLNGVCECYNCQERYAIDGGKQNRVIVRYEKIKSTKGAMRELDRWVCGVDYEIPTRVVEYNGKYDEYENPILEVYGCES